MVMSSNRYEAQGRKILHCRHFVILLYTKLLPQRTSSFFQGLLPLIVSELQTKCR